MVQTIETEAKKENPKTWMDYLETLKHEEFKEVTNETLIEFYLEIKRIHQSVLDELIYRNLKKVDINENKSKN